MKPGREVDARIAREVFGYQVWPSGGEIFEKAPQGDRPVRNYSTAMEFAQEVMEKLKMTIIPIQGDGWFVFVGPEDRTGWESPHAVLQFLESGNFAGCGAASGQNLPALVCEAALKAVEKRLSEKQALEPSSPSGPTKNNVTSLH